MARRLWPPDAQASAPVLILAAVLLYVWRLVVSPLGVAFPPGSDFTDLLVTHLPNAEYARHSLWAFVQWPLWNAQLFAGQPFAADPLAGLWYPPAWLLLLPRLPLSLGYNLLFVLHLAWAGWGVQRLLLAEGLHQGPALLGGLAFAGAPKLVAHLGAGHASLVFAVAWTPWLLTAVRAAMQTGGWRRGALAGAALALTVLADVRWSLYAGLLAVAYGAWLWVRAAAFDRASGGAPQRFRVAAAAAFVFWALLLSAVLLLPLLEFVQHSSRAALTLAEAAIFSLPPVSLLGLLLRDVGGFHEHITYAGTLTLLLALLGLGRRTLFWCLALVAAAAFALGDNFVVFPWLFKVLPGLSLLRVPPRAWFIVALGLCVLAGHGAQALTVAWWPRLAARYARLRVRLPSGRAALLLLGIVLALDLARFDSTLLSMRPVPALNAAAAWLLAQAGPMRVYSPSYSLPAGDGLEHVDGVDPLQLAAVVKFMEAATGVRAAGYSVTIPAFADGAPAVANREALPNARLLGLLNVRYVVAEYPLPAAGLQAVRQFGSTHVYENREWRPRAWLASGDPVALVSWSPNRIVLTAAGPGRLVLSEVAYPGWQVTVNGRPTSIETDSGILRAVALPAGPQTVVFTFRPFTVYLGLALSVLGLAGLVWVLRRGP